MAEHDTQVVKDVDLSELTKDAFTKVADYLNGELEASTEDYKMLEKINKVSAAKYADLRNIVSNVNSSMQQLDEKYNALRPYISQIDDIELAVNALEQSAYKLDAYSKQLELRYKELEKR
ncbi:biogenesis of lysosome-related organelles complex 1 subunit 2-like [Watersipora subatra]|uniref:biogenesis of lysosome-related organelles complex 1 subunit 2-like n=1 Tax=Watersipora subatra TaxID=2589382 RepID=UPI00355B1434